MKNLEELKTNLQNLKTEINKEKRLLDNVQRMYTRRKDSYDKLCRKYEKADYQLALMDGRLTIIIDIEPPEFLKRNSERILKNAVSQLSSSQVENLLNDLINQTKGGKISETEEDKN